MQYQCKQCLAMTDLPAGTDPHSVNWCECCTVPDDTGEVHHHGANAMTAEDCAAANHPGEPCFDPQSGKPAPEGCTVCRPVIHFAVVGDPQAVS
jgi:hypothetical protein